MMYKLRSLINRIAANVAQSPVPDSITFERTSTSNKGSYNVEFDDISPSRKSTFIMVARTSLQRQSEKIANVKNCFYLQKRLWFFCASFSGQDENYAVSNVNIK